MDFVLFSFFLIFVLSSLSGMAFLSVLVLLVFLFEFHYRGSLLLLFSFSYPCFLFGALRNTSWSGPRSPPAHIPSVDIAFSPAGHLGSSWTACPQSDYWTSPEARGLRSLPRDTLWWGSWIAPILYRLFRPLMDPVVLLPDTRWLSPHLRSGAFLGTPLLHFAVQGSCPVAVTSPHSTAELSICFF